MTQAAAPATAELTPSVRIAPTSVHARNGRVDFWRGLCILGMVSWHILTDASFPKWFSFPVIQAFNFVAEGFVLLAGVSVGMGFRRPMKSSRYWRRAGDILILHYGMVAALAVLLRVGAITSLTPTPPRNDGILGPVLALRYQPYLADVLSIFFFLFLLTPLLIWIRRRLGTGALLAISLGTYVSASMAPVVSGLAAFANFDPNSNGAFDLGSWQLVYVLGLLLGERLDAIESIDRRRYRQLFTVLLAVFVAAGAFRIACELSFDGINMRLRTILFGRHPLGPARLTYILLQLALIGLLTENYWPSFSSQPAARAVVLLGRCSLPVFMVSVIADYVLKSAISRLKLEFPVNLGCWFLEIAILFAVACWLTQRGGRQAIVN